MNVNKCAICQAVFGKWADFNMHHQSTHGMFDRRVRPEKTTDRTKAQIVADFEKTNRSLFIEDEHALSSPQDGCQWQPWEVVA